MWALVNEGCVHSPSALSVSLGTGSQSHYTTMGAAGRVMMMIHGGWWYRVWGYWRDAPCSSMYVGLLWYVGVRQEAGGLAGGVPDAPDSHIPPSSWARVFSSSADNDAPVQNTPPEAAAGGIPQHMPNAVKPLFSQFMDSWFLFI